MLGKKVKSRSIFLLSFFIFLVFGAYFFLKSLESNVIYFLSPTEINNIQEHSELKKLRVGGMVKKNSIKINQNSITFIITDFKNEIIVDYSGAIPNLFSEGKGVVAQGHLKDKKYFLADKILAKHDEKYMPPEADLSNKKDSQ